MPAAQLTLDLPAPTTSATHSPVPTPVTLRTAIDAYRLADGYLEGFCYEQAADGTPMLETHFLYHSETGEYLGVINRVLPHLSSPWQIAARGVPESRTLYPSADLQQAIAETVKWHYQNQQDLKDWLQSFAKGLRHNVI
jgi:hypothetical protein